MPRVTVVGLGYMGLPTALLIAQSAEFSVSGCDVDARKVEGLNAGKLPFDEPGLADLWARTRERFTAGTSPRPADIFILALPTPIDANKRCDLKYVEAAARSIAPVLENGNLVVLESTVLPGATEHLGRLLAEHTSAQISLGYVSEKAVPGNTLHEMIHNDRVIGVSGETATQRIAALYKTFVKGELHFTTTRTAEAAKLFENTYRDVNIALANELALLAVEHGIDVFETIALANRHPRVKILSPGPGVGGHCIAIDPWFLVQDKTSGDLVRTARRINDERPHLVAACVHDNLGRKGAGKICLLGSAYKPDVDDDRESPTYTISEDLQRHGYEVVIHDPHVRGDHVVKDLDKALHGAVAVVLATNHREYRALSEAQRAALPALVVDTHGTLESQVKAGSRYVLVGRS